MGENGLLLVVSQCKCNSMCNWKWKIIYYLWYKMDILKPYLFDLWKTELKTSNDIDDVIYLNICTKSKIKIVKDIPFYVFSYYVHVKISTWSAHHFPWSLMDIIQGTMLAPLPQECLWLTAVTLVTYLMEKRPFAVCLQETGVLSFPHVKVC